MTRNKQGIAIISMFFFNIIGAFLLFFPELTEYVLSLTPFNILLMGIMVFWANNDRSFNFIKTATVVFFLGLVLEILGVNSKLIFGEYFYGKTLGYKIFNTPVIMGLNWVTLSIASYGIASYVFKPTALITVFASLIMVMTDYIIEPIAPLLDLWYWEGGSVPAQNYVAWFIISLVIQTLFVRAQIKINIKLSLALLFSQILFFVIQFLNYGLF